MTAKLFQPIMIGSLEIRNRVFVAPMCQYSCENRDGVPGDWHSVHYPAMAAGGAGLVMVEATAVTPIGRISAWDTGLWNQEQIDAWRHVVALVKQRGAAIGVQLAHAGRKGSTYRDGAGAGTMPESEGGWQTVAPSAVAFDGYEKPRELGIDELTTVVEQWRAAARNAVTAGFDLIEIHSAHGYLLHEFLSPLSNQRTDAYGGSLENRARLLLEIVTAVRAEVGSGFPLMVRFSATDYHPNGLTPEEVATAASWALQAGADFFDISSGGLVSGVAIPLGPGYQVKFAELAVEQPGVRVSAVGQITSGKQAEEILQSTKIEAVSIGRAILTDPFWTARAAQELGEQLDYLPWQYKRGVWPAS